MRLGISTLLIAALATASLVGCGDSDTGSGGGGGAGGGATGTGGDDTGAGGDDTGAGGDDTGAGGGAGGGGTDGLCTTENVAAPADCDADCDRFLTNNDAGVTKCTASCVDNTDCSDDGSIVCAEDSATGNTLCLPQCGEGFVCDGEDVCDEASLLCFPDQLSDG